MKKSLLLSFALVLALSVPAVATAAYPTLDGSADNQVDSLGYYYAVTGGLFPTGTIPNGDNASGGTFRYLTDDPAWGLTVGSWQKDDWYSNNASIALTLKNSSTIVYDNNGLENGTVPTDYYNYGAGFPVPGAGAVVGYSMANNYDFIYTGYLNLTAPTTFTQVIGYFIYSGNSGDITAGFNPDDSHFRYHSNIWSNVSGNLLPVNTGSFVGDVFSSDNTPGTFTWSDTGYDRIGSASQQNIYRMTYTLDAPLTLQAGTYWFGDNATMVPEPETYAMMLAGLGLMGFIARRRKQKLAAA